MSEHLDLDALADLLAEVDDADRTHLDTCSACRTRLAELAAAMPAVAASLAALEVPAEPADLGARLDAALAALATEAAAPATPVADVLPLARRPRTRWMPALAAVAAAAVLVTGGVLVAQRDGGDADRTADEPPYVTSATGTNYTPATLQGALPGLLSGRAADSGTGSTAGAAAGPTTSSDARGPESTLQSNADALATLRTTPGLASCLSAVLDPAEEDLPLALDYAGYQGKPALVIVLPTVKADKVDVFVVGAGCAQADAQLLYFTRLTKP